MVAVAYFVTDVFTVTNLPWWSALVAYGGALCFALCLALVLWRTLRHTGRPR